MSFRFLSKILFWPALGLFLVIILPPKITDILPENIFLDSAKTEKIISLPEILFIPEIFAKLDYQTIIPINFSWQKYNLSCEAASLQMALSAKEIFISQDKIMEKVGYDNTPHQNGIWGNPDLAFVGDINGKICQTGYGVHWDPIAKAAQSWRPAESFSGWTLKKLINELTQGNPVIIWGISPADRLHTCFWQTPEGKTIKTYLETHVRLAVGFLGEPENPTEIILYDPLYGKLYWNTAYFLKNWQSFNFSGVVVR